MALLIINKAGIYCEQGDFYIDPWKPVKRALITHAHSDHARWGMESYLCHPLTAPILRHRLGKDIKIETLDYGEGLKINGVEVSYHPAGHLPGSAQIRLAYGGEVWVVSGDYKLEQDDLSAAFEPVSCDHFITESTFGLPIYRWPEPQEVFEEVNRWWRQNQAEGRASIIGAYSLGKAQRLLSSIDAEIGPVIAHGAVEIINQIFREEGLRIPQCQNLEDVSKKDYGKALIIAPPSAMNSAWSKKFGKQSTAFCSGWMSVRGQRRRRSADRGFVLSDHADWPGLNKAVLATGAENIFVTHGYKDIFSRWLREEHGLNAQSVETLYEGESLESD